MTSSISEGLPTRQVKANHLSFCVEERGPENGEPIVFVMGLGCQMTFWPEALLETFAQQGYRVIRFDNRDVGLSEKVSSHIRVDTRLAFFKHKLGIRFRSAYSLHDMAQDLACLIDALGYDNVHVVGISMGGMIAQLLAAKYPDRVRSLNLLMTSTNAPNLPPPDFKVLLRFATMKPAGHDEETAVQRWLEFWQVVSSPEHEVDLAEVEARVRLGYQRSYCPAGTLRQMHAILASGSLKPYSKKIKAPTLVLHGRDDPLLKPICGRAVARAIGHAHFEELARMGHDLPAPLLPRIAAMIQHNCEIYQRLAQVRQSA